MATTTPCDDSPDVAGPGAGRPIRPGPDTLRIVLGRATAIAVFTAAVHFGLQVWHGAMIAALIVGAAWLLGRVD